MNVDRVVQRWLRIRSLKPSYTIWTPRAQQDERAQAQRHCRAGLAQRLDQLRGVAEGEQHTPVSNSAAKPPLNRAIDRASRSSCRVTPIMIPAATEPRP